MAAHPYGLRNRLNGQSSTVRTTPTGSPIAKTGSRSPRKIQISNQSLQLTRVIGTTTNSPNGLACSSATNTYAYCAGVVVVLAKIQNDGSISHRYFKARPTVSSVNPPTAHYESQSPVNTPTRRRTTNFGNRRAQDEYQSNGIGRDWADDSNGNTWTARERIKSATCTALSHDGRWLAVGESGYSPRVLLFSTLAESALEIPISIVSDHTFGVRSVSFSPDLRYLATLGNLNDGFLFIWNFNSKTGTLKLQSTNKCTTNVCDMVWCGDNLVTVGTRHVKIWQAHLPSDQSPFRRFKLRAEKDQTSSPSATALQGRNCLLGSLADSTFTCVTSVSEDTAVMGTDSGHICLLHISERSVELKVLKDVGFSITSVSFRSYTKSLHLGGRWGLFHENLDSLQEETTSKIESNLRSPRRASRNPRFSSIRRSLGITQKQKTGVVAVGCLSEHTITLDDDGNLKVLRDGVDEETDVPTTFSSHNSMIQGVQILPTQAGLGDFLTWSKNGELRYWNLDGKLLSRRVIDLDLLPSGDEDNANELKVVRFIPKMNQLLYGDRLGVIKLVEREILRVSSTCRAHGADINDIAFDEDSMILATCGRDRVVQVFQIIDSNLQLLQTLDDHIGAVSQVSLTSNADLLISCSTDRTIVIRNRLRRELDGVEKMAFLTSRVITLKATPLSMSLEPAKPDLLLVSTMDRQVMKLDMLSGTVLESFKVTDVEYDDTVILNSIWPSRLKHNTDETNSLLVGISSTDKSIRLYDYERGLLLSRESGHTEGVSDVALLEQMDLEKDVVKRTVISTGVDGTILIWKVSNTSPLIGPYSQDALQGLLRAGSENEEAIIKNSPVTIPPLRKILTKGDVADFTQNGFLAAPDSPRAFSPPRLHRKTSRLNLTTTIEEANETDPSTPLPIPEINAEKERGRPELRRLPSSPTNQISKKSEKASQTDSLDMRKSKKAVSKARSPSPPPSIGAKSMPNTPNRRQAQTPGHPRLRRPPSMPADLHAHGKSQSKRRLSVCSGSTVSTITPAIDPGIMTLATQQTCRTLKLYRKKIVATKEEHITGLDILETELESLLKVVRKRNHKLSPSTGTNIVERGEKIGDMEAKENMDSLTALLNKTSLADSTSTDGVNTRMG